MGDTLSSFRLAGAPSSGGGDAFLAGGVHNFPRFLENWGSTLSYCGSLINLFNSINTTAATRAEHTYSPPTRNWVFDASFLDVNPSAPRHPLLSVCADDRIRPDGSADT